MALGRWRTVTVAQNGTTSDAVDLLGAYKKLLVLIPALDSATVNVSVSNDNSTFFPLNALDDDATGSFLHAHSASTTAMAVFYEIGGCQFIKIICGASQTSADRTFYVRGVD